MFKALLVLLLIVGILSAVYLSQEKNKPETTTYKTEMVPQPKQTTPIAVTRVKETTQTERELNKFGLTLDGASPISVR